MSQSTTSSGFSATALLTPDRRSPSSLRVLGGHPSTFSAPSTRQMSGVAPNAFATPGRSVSAGGGPSGSSSAGAGAAATTTKAVRFSPAHPTANYFNSAYSPSSSAAAPPTRLQGSPISRSTPLPTTRPSVAPPSASQSPTPLKHASASSTSPRRSATDKARFGRVEVASRLRINACCLVGSWLAARTNLYTLVLGHVVQLVPSLDAPLTIAEKLFQLVLFFNICDAMFRLNALSSLPPTPSRSRTPSPYVTPSSSRPASRRTSPISSSSSSFTPGRSSPKTRSSPAAAPSPTISRLESPITSSPHRVVSNQKSPSTPSLQPRRSGVLGRSSLSRSSSAGTPGASEAGILAAYFVRHSPSTMTSNLGLSVNSREDIDRILGE